MSIVWVVVRSISNFIQILASNKEFELVIWPFHLDDFTLIAGSLRSLNVGNRPYFGTTLFVPLCTNSVHFILVNVY